ncbi:MAG: DegT/DnrJ/EryC1/StrS family aminotransferase [Saprospiraceae bacterium]|nr:DegT/DnrJ/EryC1/StrS family aminotransferase [Saprospiraceae bacterium]MDP4998659.1 DegT/DnrJ/EryC1/StrS family aminotransferase [Saprospiraceae bacterium]
MNPIQIPYENLKKVNEPYLDALKAAANEVVHSGWYILGAQVQAFEQAFSAIHNNSYCLGVASGLDALVMGLEVFDFPKGKKVLVPSNTYIASVLAIIKAGLQPVLVEPNPETYNLDVAGLEQKYDSDCVAILPVHLYGRLCPMEEIVAFAQDKGLKIVEDCAQAHFASSHGKLAGTFGDIGAFSFYPTKNLGALGDAGAMLCKDEAIYEKLRAIRNYGSHQKYYNKYIGWNSRLDEIQAAFLLAKLGDRDRVIAHKRKLANLYFELLGEQDGITLPKPGGEDHVWHIFNVLVDDRDNFRTHLLQRGIGTEIHYPLAPHQQEGYQCYFAGEQYPLAAMIHANTVSLPISTCHSESDIAKVASVIVDYCSAAAYA